MCCPPKIGSCPCMLHRLLSSRIATQHWPCCSSVELCCLWDTQAPCNNSNSGELKLNLSIKLSLSRPRQFVCLSSSTTPQQPLNIPPRLSVSACRGPSRPQQGLRRRAARRCMRRWRACRPTSWWASAPPPCLASTGLPASPLQLQLPLPAPLAPLRATAPNKRLSSSAGADLPALLADIRCRPHWAELGSCISPQRQFPRQPCLERWPCSRPAPRALTPLQLAGAGYRSADLSYCRAVMVYLKVLNCMCYAHFCAARHRHFCCELAAHRQVICWPWHITTQMKGCCELVSYVPGHSHKVVLRRAAE